jgi:ABC-type transport system substrate-binding protein
MQSFKSTNKSKSTLSLYLQQLLIEREKARARANGININDKFYSSFRSNKYNSTKSSTKSSHIQNKLNRSTREFKSKETDIVEESDEELNKSHKSQTSTGFDVDKQPIETSTNPTNISLDTKPSLNNKKNRKSIRKLIDREFNVNSSLKKKSLEKIIISKEINLLSKSTISCRTSTILKNDYHPRKNFSKKPTRSKKLAKVIRLYLINN